jgi:hypothetical protein
MSAMKTRTPKTIPLTASRQAACANYQTSNACFANRSALNRAVLSRTARVSASYSIIAFAASRARSSFLKAASARLRFWSEFSCKVHLLYRVAQVESSRYGEETRGLIATCRLLVTDIDTKSRNKRHQHEVVAGQSAIPSDTAPCLDSASWQTKRWNERSATRAWPMPPISDRSTWRRALPYGRAPPLVGWPGLPICP